MRTLLLAGAGILALLAGVVGSCGTLDVTDGHFAGMELYEPPGGGFHLHYANPPWALAEEEHDYGSYAPDLVVEAVYFGLSLSLDAYLLQVEHLDGLTCNEAAVVARELALAEGETVDFDVRAFANHAGDEGLDLGTRGGALQARLPEKAQETVSDRGYTVRARRVFFPSAGGCFQVLVVSVYELDEPDLTHMLRSFEPRSSGAAGAAP